MIKCYCYLSSKEDSVIIRKSLKALGIKVVDVAKMFEMSVPYIYGIFEGRKFMPKSIYDYLVDKVNFNSLIDSEVYNDVESRKLMY